MLVIAFLYPAEIYLVYLSLHVHLELSSIFCALTVWIPVNISTKWFCVWALSSALSLICLLIIGETTKVIANKRGATNKPRD